MARLRIGIAVALAAMIWASPQASAAQEVLEKIEVLVNDEVISAFDVQQRLGLVVAATGGVRNEEELMRLRSQVLQSMVDEKLQLQEAAEFELEVEDAELEGAYVRVAANFNQSPEQFEQFLAQFGSSKKSLLNQLRAEFAWQELVRGRLGSQVVISDAEVEQRLDYMNANAGKYEYRLSEIYLIVDVPSRDGFVRQRAARLIEQIQEGAPFEGVARQFSESATAARGGDLGWLAAGQMEPEIEAAIGGLELRGVSAPIRSAGGYYIIQLRDRRRILDADPLDAQLEIHQIAYPFTAETTQEEAEAWLAKAEVESKGVNSCDQISELAATLGTQQFGSAGYVSLRDMGPQLAELLQSLEIGEPSRPIAAPDGARVFFVCDRREAVANKPTFDSIFNQLEQQRLAMMARRYLRDLRRDAIVDYR